MALFRPIKLEEVVCRWAFLQKIGAIMPTHHYSEEKIQYPPPITMEPVASMCDPPSRKEKIVRNNHKQKFVLRKH